jgi:predicted membrane-bound spermidine synthase
MILDHLHGWIKHLLDFAALVLAALGFIATNVLPGITALIGFVWYCIRFHDWFKERKLNADQRKH